jgi:phage shock protein C
MSGDYKKLYRSRQNRWIGGICGGIGEYFDVDPVLIRVAFLLVAILGWPLLILLYLVMLIIVPIQPITNLHNTI